jgi:hypothetical protein
VDVVCVFSLIGSGFARTALLRANARMEVQRRSDERIGETVGAP